MDGYSANLSAKFAFRGLRTPTSQIASANERLSSGRRVNTASDDAAGLSLAASLRNTSNHFNRGIRNVNDGLSYLNVAQSAANELEKILIRTRELANQAANSNYTSVQREALDEEAQQLVSQYNSILSSTTSNGRQIFGATNSVVTVSTGGESVDSVTVDVQLPPTESADVADTNNASISTGGVQADQNSALYGISPDGRYILFSSSGTNIVAGDSNGQNDVFLRDTEGGTTVRVSLTNAGGQGNGPSSVAKMDSDANVIVFTSNATNLAAGDADATLDIFARDINAGTTTLVNQSTGGVKGNNVAFDPAVSGDGRYVVFTSSATNLVAGDTNATVDVFMRDLQTSTTTRISVSTGGTEGDGISSMGNGTVGNAVSSDGRYVVFQSAATNLVAGDVNGAQDVFLRDTVLNTTTLVSVSSGGVQGNGNSGGEVGISSDGRYVMFSSLAGNLVSGDTTTEDIFIRDLLTGTTTRVTNDSGAVAAGSISDDGRYVAYTSTSTTLVAGDTNGVADIFVTDTQTGEHRLVSQSASGVIGNAVSANGIISADGSRIAFHSAATNLSTGDANARTDAFFRDNTFGDSESSLDELSGIDLTSSASATTALTTLETYDAQVTAVSANINAGLSRFSFIVSGLAEKKGAADIGFSRITDVDSASELAKLVSGQIRSDGAGAALAQVLRMNTDMVDLLRNSVA